MEPVGIHRWKGSLYLVGTADGRPVVAQIEDSGAVSAPTVWASSQRIANAFGRSLTTDDDRVQPRRSTVLEDPRATGAFPLVTEHSSDLYAEDSTLVTIAGPVVGEGAASFSLVAVAPAGVRYP
jgi:hypothetical protein